MREDSKDLLAKALTEIRRLKTENAALKNAAPEPIAVVGMACRFPEGCGDPEAYWEFLAAGKSAIKPTPPDRADGTTGTFGSYLEDTDLFDAGFFGISPKEAQSLDPQQRLLLEVAWHAFESGNIRPDTLAGRDVGVFVGMSGIDYALKLFAPGNRERIDPYFGTGSTLSPAAGRLSYFLKVTGPSLVVDTACSSSLVAIHLASESLRRGECEAALAAGVNRILGPDLTLNFAQSGLLAPDGRCYTFDARAQGYSRGEGAGALVLKRLSDAQAAGDTIFAVIRGSAVNQDGGSGGLTVPSGPAQQRAMRRALQVAGLAPADVDYVEAHGTATPLGDPIEVHAMSEVFSPGREGGRPLRIGSVKTNFGHLEAAAGMASCFKVIQALRHEAIPPHLNFAQPSPAIDWQGAAIAVVDALQPWPRSERPRVAGVSGFGFAGTNAHVVFSEAPLPKTVAAESGGAVPAERGAQVFLASAKSADALKAQAGVMAERLGALPADDWPAAAHTSVLGRVPFAERLCVVAETAEEAASCLRGYAAAGKARGVAAGRAREQARAAFVFTGQGSQYAGMGRALYASQPVFRAIVDDCAERLRGEIGRDLRDVMFAEAKPAAGANAAGRSVLDAARNLEAPAEIDETVFTQTGLFTIEYALARLWESWGVKPQLTLGHSVGEYAAACIAGVFELGDALKLIAARGRLMQERSAPGAMLTVFAEETDVARMVAPHAATAAIAAVNGPGIVLVSGAEATIATLAREFDAAGWRAVRMRIAQAFHSPLTEPVLKDFGAVAASLTLRRPKIPLLSNVTGGFVDEEVTRPDYWVRHLRQGVRFCESMTLLHEQKLDFLVEVGPEPALLGLDLCFRMVREKSASRAKWVPSLRRGQDDMRSLLDSAGRLWTGGAPIDWSAVHGGRVQRRVVLPGYQFQRKRHWFDFAPSSTGAAATPASAPSAIDQPSSIPAPAITPPIQPSTMSDSSANSPASSHRHDPARILAEVQAIIGEVSGLEAADLPREANLLEMGLDSLMFVRSGRIIEKRFQVKISIAQFYAELHRIGALVDFLVANSAVDLSGGAPAAAEAKAQSQPVAAAAATAIAAVAPSVALPTASSIAGAATPVASSMPAGLDPVMAAHFQLMERYLALRAGATAPVAAATPAGQTATSPSGREAMSGKLAVNFGGLNLEEEKNLSAQQKDFLHALAVRLTAKTKGSKARTQAWRRELADWKGSLQFKRSLKELKYPIVSDRAKGARIWDVDGNEYIDLALGMGVHFLGHSPDYVTAALHRQIDRTTALGPQSDLAGDVAKKICQLTGAERASLAITGSGAVMLAQRIARAATGRPLIAQFAGAYHGIGSEVLVVGGEEGSRPLSPGIPASVVQNAQVLDYGSEEALAWIREHAAQLAAVIVEPVQSRRPGFQPHRFLRRLRKLTEELDIVLIFDEMINGFRIHGGGAQAWFGIRADLVTYGKIVGGGMPLAVVAGKAKLLDWIDGGFWQFGDDSTPTGRTIFTGGTHNRHPLALAAAGAALDHLIEQGPALHEAANRKTERLGKELNAFFEAEAVSFRVAWFGSQFRFEALGEAFDLEVFFYLLTEQGFYTWEQRICCLSVAHTDEDVDRLIEAAKQAVAQMRAGGFAIQAGPRAPRRVLPLSSVQHRLYALCQREGAEMPYHLSGVWEMRGPVDLFKLQDAFQEVVRRHESLRTAFGLIGGKPCQYVFEEPRFFLEEIKAGGKSADEVLAAFIRPFNLEQPPLLRVGYATLEAGRTLLLIDVHHIAADGLSMNVILQEFAQLYDGVSLGPVKRQYRHAIEEVESRKRLPEYKAEETYWRNEMAGEIPLLDLPADWPRSGEMDFRGDKCGIVVDAERTRRLEALARQHGASLYMVLLGAYVTLLHRMTGAEDLIVGLPVAGRPGADNDEVVGMFVNSLPLRFRPKADQPFTELLRALRATCLGAYDHSEYAFAELVEQLDLPRNPDRSPLFDTMFAYESADDRVMRTRELEIRTIDQFEGSGMFDLSVDIIRERGALSVRFHYATRLFRRETIERYGAAFDRLLDALLEQPARQIGRLAMLPAAELELVTGGFNRISGVADASQTLLSLWQTAVQAHPDATALVGKEQTLTYRETNDSADVVARRLVTEFCVKPGDRVALLVDASEWMIVALLGVMKAGAAYVPIDVANPPERVRALLRDAGARVLIVDNVPDWSETAVRPVALRALCEPVPSGYPAELPELTPDMLAYVIFTSGSTGKPKGVMIEHGAIANSIQWRMRAYPFSAHDATLLMPTYAFDASVLDIFPTLASGARLVLVSAADKRDLAAQAARMKRERITNLLLTPSLYSLYLDEIADSLRGLRWVCVAGEATTLSLVRKHFERLPGTRLFNEYGPTENSVVTTFTELFPTDQVVTIGRPVAGHRVHIIQPNGERCGIGVPGELVVSGAGLARGYLNQPGLTEAAFTPAPWNAQERIYRTGDLARWRPDGTLDFLGRRDGQVKLRGYRIELDEIEDVLRRQPGVTAAAAKLAVIGGEPQLVAYLTRKGGLDEAEVRTACQNALPVYMVPSVFVWIDAMPLNTSGKIDRRALPVPQEIAVREAGGPPRGEREVALAQVWRDVLKQPEIGRDEDYFRLGGDSIKGIQIISRLLQAGWRLDMRWLFRHPTIAGLAPRLESTHKAANASVEERVGEVPLGPIQRWFLGTCTVRPEHFNQGIWLDGRGRWNIEAMQAALRHVVAAHDAFRYRYASEGGAWRQHCAAGAGTVAMRVVDLRGKAQIEEQLAALVRAEQAAIDLEAGPLTRALIVQMDAHDRLFWTAHHLVVDGVSWRVLLEDLSAAYAAADAGQALPSVRRTVSFGHWTRTVAAVVAEGRLEDEATYWQEMAARPEPRLPYDSAEEAGKVADLRSLSAAVSAELSERLLRTSHTAYRTRGVELLVAAFRVAYAGWNPGEPLELMLEGHGRESGLAELDVSRTVGWFTSVYPMQFPTLAAAAAGPFLIRDTKERLRRVPRNGAGFGWWQARGASFAGSERLRRAISFNFLGSFEADETGGAFRLSAERPVGAQDAGQRVEQSISIVGYAAGGRMYWTFEYDSARWQEPTIRRLLDRFVQALDKVAGVTAAARDVVPSPADFVYRRMDLAAFDRMVERREWPAEAIADVYPLSPMQKGLYYEAIKAPSSEAYFEQMSFCLDGAVKLEALQQSWRDLVARHPALRSVFVPAEGDDEPLQVVWRAQDADVSVVSLLGQSEAQQREAVAEFQGSDRASPFTLESGSLMRVRIFQLGRERLQLVWSHHHILMDGWCVGILYEDLMRCYEARVQGRVPKLELAADYRSYLHWLQTLDRKASVEFWRRELAGYERVTSLPRNLTAGAGEYRCAKSKLRLEGPAWTKLQALATAQGATTGTLLNALWGILLARYNQSEDLVFGAIVSGRPEAVPDVEKMIGLFINALPVRLKFSATETLAEMLRRFQAQALERRPHEYLPLAEIAEQAGLREVFDHLVVLENYPMDEELRGDGDGRPAGARPRLSQIDAFERTHLDFTLVAVPRARGLEIEMTYNEAVYSAALIGRVQAHLTQLVEVLAAHPAAACLEVDFVPVAERRLLEDWNETAACYPSDATIHGLFAEQASLHPQRLATTTNGQSLTYAQLDAAARQLASELVQAGVRVGDRVAIWLPRGNDMIVSLLATIMAGGCYVPLDPEYPEERLRFILEDSGARVVVSHSQHRSPFAGLREICLDEPRKSATATLPEVGADTPAYIIYTSGSTGKPKGCLITHRNVVRLLKNDRFDFAFGPDDVWVVAHSFCFDFSVWEMYGALTYGGRVVVAPRETVRDIRSFVDLVIAEGVTVLNQTPAAFYAFATEALLRRGHDFSAQLRYVIFGGDRLEPRYLAEWTDRYGVERPQLINMYGITETTVHVTFHRVTADEIRAADGRSIIGRPLPETRVWVLDRQQRVLPIGIVGELYVGGTGVGLGYLNRPELTAERFLPEPQGHGGRLYRSGDLGRWRDDGQLEYLGRNDHQVQVRGFRVELGEVEAACLAQDGIEKAVVLPHEETAGQVELVAYLVGTRRSASELRTALIGRLPHYMVPSYFEWVTAIPLTANGKIDRKALPKPGAGADSSREKVAPRTETEGALLALWREVLGVTEIGIHDNFFDLGGQSLKAVRLRAKIESVLNATVSLRDLFARPTIAELAQTIAMADDGDGAAATLSPDLAELVEGLTPEEIEAQLRKL